MAGIINLKAIQNEAGTITIPPEYLERRIIQRTTYTHRIGWWRGNNTYYWVPGAYVDFRPERSDSRVRISFSIPTRDYGAAHMISHWIFYRDEIEYGRHSRSGHHVENPHCQEWDVPSWGAGQYSRLGYKVRAYSEGNHNVHLYYTEYWDGGGAGYSIVGQATVEEYIPASTGYKVQVFTGGNSSWKAPKGVYSADVLVVAGGGGGGMDMGGGGGAGGVLYQANYAVTPEATYNVVVGSGGYGGPRAGTGIGTQNATAHQYTKSATRGENSVFTPSTNLIPNGQFTTNTYWGYSPAHATITADTITFLPVAGDIARATNTNVGGSAGTQYVISIDVESNPGDYTIIVDDDGAGAGVGSVTTYLSRTGNGMISTGTFSNTFTRTASPRIRIMIQSATGTTTQRTIVNSISMYPVSGSIVSYGGGYGGSSYFGYTPNNGYGSSGGSGGGASGYSDGNSGRNGAGTAGQGYNGGTCSGQYYSGGGGGAGGPGANGPNQANGGNGVANAILGPTYYWGGGGGGAGYSIGGGNGGLGGGGGGAVGTTYGGIGGIGDGLPGGGGGTGTTANTPGGDGAPGTGGGGGGGSHYQANNNGGNGGSGIVIVRWKPADTSEFSAGILLGSSSEFAAESAWALKAARPEVTSGYYWIKPPGQVARYCYCDFDYHGGYWVLVQTVGSATPYHGSTTAETNLYTDTSGRSYVPLGGEGYSSTTGRRLSDAWIKALGAVGEGTFRLDLARNGARPTTDFNNTYANPSTDWRYTAFIRYDNGISQFNSTNNGGDADKVNKSIDISHVYPYSWETGGTGHYVLFDSNYRVFDMHSNPSSIQSSRYSQNRFLWQYPGTSANGIYGGSDSFTGAANGNPGYMWIR